MKFHPTEIDGVIRIELRLVEDSRGWFARTFCSQAFAEQGLASSFPQTNHSLCRRRGILRGLHYQRPPRAEAKLVRCVRGRIFDVAVDVRQSSPTFLKWYGIELCADRPEALYIGPGMAHGYQSLTDDAAVIYQASEPYAPELEECIKYDDPAVGIHWPIVAPELSAKDHATPWLGDAFGGIELAEVSPGGDQQ